MVRASAQTKTRARSVTTLPPLAASSAAESLRPLAERDVAVVTAGGSVPHKVRAADRAAPVEAAEGDRREQEDERRRVRHLLRKAGERRRDRAADAERDQQQDDGQLPRAKRAVGAEDLAALRRLAQGLELRGAERRREERAPQQREVALDPGDPHEPGDPAYGEADLLEEQREVVRGVEARGEEDPADEHAPRAFAQVVAREEVAGDPGPGDVADGAGEGAGRRRDEKGAYERPGHPGPCPGTDRTEV